MQPQRQSLGLSKVNQVSNIESPSTGRKTELKKTSHGSTLDNQTKPNKKVKLAYAPDNQMEQNKKQKIAYAPAHKTSQGRNTGKNAARFESSTSDVVGTVVAIGNIVAANGYDVVGTVVAIGNIVAANGYGCSKFRRTVVIEDAQSLRLECTFWDTWAHMWNEYAKKLDEVGHLDFVMILGKIRYWNNKPAIHNALFGTRIFINKDIQPLISFRKSTQSGQSPVVTPAEFMQGFLKKMVGMIRNIDPRLQAYNMKVDGVIRVVKHVTLRLLLFQQKELLLQETKTTMALFKIIVRIFDESGSAQVVIFDNNVYRMINLSAWEIMEEQGMNIDAYFLDNLNQIIRKLYMFKIKYTEFNHNNNSHIYRAEKVIEDVETINYFKTGFFEYEVVDEDTSSESNQMNEDAEDEITSQHNDQHTEDAIDDSTSPSTEMNEEKEDEMSSNDITTGRVQPNAVQGQPKTQNEPACDLLALGTNPKQVRKKMISWKKKVIIIESSDDEVDIVASNKHNRLNKYSNFAKTADENTLDILEDESSGKNVNQVKNNKNLKKEIIIVDSSDDQVDLVAPNKTCMFKKELIFVNKNDVSIMPCDDENSFANIEDEPSGKNQKEVTNNEKLEKDVNSKAISDDEVDTDYAERRKTNDQLNNKDTNTDSEDEGPAVFKRSTKRPHTTLQKKRKISCIEDSDEEEGNIQKYNYPDTCYNINDNDEDGEAYVHKQHKFTLLDEDTDEEEGNIQNYIYPDTRSNINNSEEDGEDLYDSDMYSVRSVSDGDEDDSFINNGPTDYDTTDDEDSDDFF
ncbi:replication protein A 70 kDa DNA-binding subunit B [Tanacetum coccineum]